jgi:lysophospholipase L1-like esterase
MGGRIGDTLAGVSRRARAMLAKVSPDVLVFAVGVNDVLVPYMASQSRGWKTLMLLSRALGSVATADAQSFHRLYARTIDQVRNRGVPHVVVTTLTCVGEELSGPLNARREEFNVYVRRLAEQDRVHLADAGRVFDDHLRKATDSASCLLPGFPRVLWDSMITRAQKGIDHLSRRRRLRLTVDGVHLNLPGARLVAETIAEQLP